MHEKGAELLWLALQTPIVTPMKPASNICQRETPLVSQYPKTLQNTIVKQTMIVKAGKTIWLFAKMSMEKESAPTLTSAYQTVNPLNSAVQSTNANNFQNVHPMRIVRSTLFAKYCQLDWKHVSLNLLRLNKVISMNVGEPLSVKQRTNWERYVKKMKTG